MKKLTQEQEQSLEDFRERQTEQYLEKNKTILFDIKRVKDRGQKVKAELDKLELENLKLKNKVRKQFLIDVERVKEFLGENEDAVVWEHYEEDFCSSYTIGINDDKKVHVTYRYGQRDWRDWEAHERINGIDYHKYRDYDIEIHQQHYDVEYHADFEKMFNDTDVVDMFEIAMQDYFTYRVEVQEEEEVEE